MNKTTERARKRIDDRLAFLRPVDRLQPPPRGWIRAIRDALGMSGPQLGHRLGIAPQSVAALERSEVAGTIQLQNLQKAANALGCTVVYALVPNTSLETVAHNRAQYLAMRALGRVSQTMKLEAQATADTDLDARVDDYIRDHISERDLWASGE